MPNTIIVVGKVTIIRNTHLHHRQESEVKDEVMVHGITEDDAGDEEEDTVGANKVPKEYQRMLL